jgi:hypothetical protein
MKKYVMLIMMVLLSIGLMAQTHWSQFAKVTRGMSVAQLKGEGDKTFDWYVKPTAQLTAMNLNINPVTKMVEASAFSAVGVGIGGQHYVERGGVLVNDFGVNALFIINGAPLNKQAGFGIAATINALSFVDVGGGRDFTNKKWLILLGGSWTF